MPVVDRMRRYEAAEVNDARRDARPPLRTPEFEVAGRTLLAATKRQLSDEQDRRTANRIAELFREGQARKKQAKTARAGPSSEPRAPAPNLRGFGVLLGDLGRTPQE